MNVRVNSLFLYTFDLAKMALKNKVSDSLQKESKLGAFLQTGIVLSALHIT